MYCADYVNVTVRVIVLFPQSVAIKFMIFMCGKESKVSILGLCALSQYQSVQMTTSQIHCGVDCQSTLVLQGLITDHAKFRYEGTIRIEKHARGTYALQNNKNILLSSTAAAISIPNIEVLHNDVQCYHGAAIGRFDEQQMQYMQSRGLSLEFIKKLLVQAFFAQVLEGHEKRELILQQIYEKI